VTEQLRQLVATSDDMTEICAASFLEGKLSEEAFIKAFKEARKLYHSRAVKLDFLQNH
jgi:molybdopterin-biosynthesis enzyme MoeA-like protein